MKQIERCIRGQPCGSSTDRDRSNRSLRRAVKLTLLACSASLATSASAQETLPTGGQIVAGAGVITASGDTMTVTQHTDRMIANWQSFSIGAGHSVDFVQPGASSVALNRVVGQDPSQILGSLDANGHVFLVNPNGIVIGRGAQVQTGGFVASTLDIENRDFLSGVHRFIGAGGAIRNEGDLSGNVVALISPSVVNDGTIAGDTALAAGTNVLLDFDGDGLLSVEVTASTVATLVENNGLIRADGGTAILTAKGASDALRGVVNNSGTVQARTLANRNGRILLLADMDHGDTNVGGTLDASAPDGGDGGFIETSAQNVRIAGDVHITTQAAAGEQGTWLIDPNDFTISAIGGNITGRGLSSALASTDVTISTATMGTPDRNGDIFVNDTVNWSANTLTLQAERNIVINVAMNGSGGAGLNLYYGQGAPALNNSARYIVNAPVNLASTGNFSTRLGSDGTLVDYTIITTLGSAASSYDGTLQGMQGDLAGNYVLGADIDASPSESWNGGLGFTPIGGNGDDLSRFTGIFDGLGHRIDGLAIRRPSTDYVGLFGATGFSAILRNVGVASSQSRGILGLSSVGGLVGSNYGTIMDAYSDRAAGLSGGVGGLAGANLGRVIRSYATGDILGQGAGTGGLVGVNFGTIEQSHATGPVIGAGEVGGLVGHNRGPVSASHATGLVIGTGDSVGGLAGISTGRITDSFATGNVNGGNQVGGLVGSIGRGGGIERSYASGSVSGTTFVGGLSGGSDAALIGDSFATGDVTGTSQVGGLAGQHEGPIRNAYATGRVTGNASTGALVGVLNGNDGIVSGFYNSETSGQGAVCGASTVTCVATGLTTQEMQDPFNFIEANWNLSTVWGKSRTGENDGYMVLRAISGTEYHYYVRSSDVSLQRTYGGANPDLSGIVLDGIGAANVTLAWGSAVTANTGAGTYSLNGTNVLNPQVSAGTAGEYYFDYGNGALTIARAALVGTAISSSRSYDGQAFAGGNGINWSGFVAGDDAADLTGTLTYGGAAQGARNAGVYGLTASGLSSGNYDITFVDATLTIDPRVISLTGSRVYDGTTDVTASALTLGNLVSGESLTLSGIGSLSDRNAGTGKALSLDSLILGGGTGLASNYTLAGGSHFVDVERRAIDVTGVAADDKVYDGTTAATLNLGSASFAGLVAGDDITVTGATGAFADKNAGAGKTVSITGLTIGGADAGNYTLGGTSATTSASITRREISAVDGIAADDKIYDGTTAATLNTTAASFSGIVAGDVLSVTSASGAFNDRNAAADKTVNITGLELGGADAGNYVLARSTSTTTASITPRAITAITGITASDKNYDGSTAAALDTRGASFAGAITGDDLRVASAEGRFASAEPGENATVYVGGLTLGGADAGNYTLVDDSATTTASINRVIVPPLQPEQTTHGNAEDVVENLFPVPAHDILSGNPPLIDAEEKVEPASVAPLDSQSAIECIEPSGTSTSRCADSAPSQRD